VAVLHVLVVDDEPAVCRLVQRTLERAGFPVVIANGGAEALELLRAHKEVGLILLDLVMPGMDGWRFRHAQQQDPRLAAIPTIIVTGAPLPPAVRDELQASEYIAKPFTPEQLVAAVRAATQSTTEPGTASDS
jgi:CheY-like chemotaxis protein